MIGLNKSNLEYMKIYRLFGQKNIYIDFHDKINIFIGENGLGKTTILSFVYNVLKIKTNYQKLLSTNFESFEIKFKGDSDVLKVSKSDIKDFSSKSDFRYFKNKSYIYEYLEAEVAMCDGVIDDEMFNYIVSKIMRRFGYPRSYVSRLFKEYLETGSMNSYTKQMSSGNRKKVVNLINKLSSNISEIVMYLPTYRRIENEFSFSMDTRNQPNNELIKFGMRDVNIAINEKLNAIKEYSINAFNRMSGILLNQYSNNDLETHIDKEKIIDTSDLDVIFNRIGDTLSEENKNKINELLKSNEIYSKQHYNLLNLLIKLQESYDKPRELDNKIMNFVDCCNDYFVDKKFEYDRGKITLKILLNDTKEEIELMDLSSGEKQIVSIFSKLYLENDRKCILIIDEPELSLSIDWQRKLIPDIIASNNCDLLLTVTHSPFIFENDFDECAKEMRFLIEE